MKRYLILFLVVSLCCSFVFADDFWSEKIPSPEQSLDRSLSSSPNWWRFVRISRDPNGTFFPAQTIFGIINFLATTDAWKSGLWNAGWSSGDVAGMQQDLLSFLDPETGFEAGSEVFDMLLQSGDSSFADGAGNVFDDTGAIWEDSAAHEINYYCGRNTALGGFNNYWTSTLPNHEYWETQYLVETGEGAYRITFWETNTPIVLDMDGDGKLEASGGMWLPHPLAKDAKTVAFDLTGNGFNEVIEWVGSNDGILLTYTEGEAVTGNNLFGKAGGYENGYEKMMTLDENKDKKLTGEELSTLSVWKDDGNAKVDKGEVVSVAGLGITEIGIEPVNMVSYFIQNDVKKTLWDWHPVMMIVKKVRDK